MFSNRYNEDAEVNIEGLTNISEEIIGDKKKIFAFYDKLRKRTKGVKPDLAQPEKLSLWDLVFFLPDFFIMFVRLMADKRIPKNRKVLIATAIGYVVLPFDFIPDAIPVLGSIDDFIFVIVALDILLTDTNENIITEHWPGKPNVIEMVTMVLEKVEKSMYSPFLKVVKAILSVTRRSE